MKLCTEDIKKLILKMGFAPQNGKYNIYFKSYPLHNGYEICVDFNAERIEYYTQSTPKEERIALGEGTTCNFSHAENFVVLECIDRLLEKGYAPFCIELEKIYPSGHEHSGRLDVLVNTLEGKAFLMIECKTWGKEYEKERKKMLDDGKGTNIKNLNQQILSSLKLPLPPIYIQEQFSDFVRDTEQKEIELQQILHMLNKKYKEVLENICN